MPKTEVFNDAGVCIGTRYSGRELDEELTDDRMPSSRIRTYSLSRWEVSAPLGEPTPTPYIVSGTSWEDAQGIVPVFTAKHFGPDSAEKPSEDDPRNSPEYAKAQAEFAKIPHKKKGTYMKRRHPNRGTSKRLW